MCELAGIEDGTGEGVLVALPSGLLTICQSPRPAVDMVSFDST